MYFEGMLVTDIVKDGFDDIIVKCDSLVSSSPYVEDSPPIFMPVLYIIYGSKDMPSTINLDNPLERTAILHFHVLESYQIADIKTGDIDGNGQTDLIINMRQAIPGGFYDRKYSSKLYFLFGKTGWQGINNYDLNSSDLKFIYDFGRDRKQYWIYDYVVKDLTGDRRDDILLPYYRDRYGALHLLLYVIYGGQEFPLETMLDDNSNTLHTTKIHGDSSIFEWCENLTVGDFDRDYKPDILMQGGYYARKDTSSNITYLIYSSVLNRQSSEPEWYLNSKTYGIAELMHTQVSSNLVTSNTVGACDINGDGYDDVFLGFSNYLVLTDNPRDWLNAEIYIIFGGSNSIFPGEITSSGNSVLKIKSTYKGDMAGSKFAFGDIDGDGFNDCLIAGADQYLGEMHNSNRRLNTFYILYGKNSFPDSIKLEENAEDLVTVKGSTFNSVGNINGDGYADILGTNYVEDKVYVLPGRNGTIKQYETIVIDLPQQPGGQINFQFSNGIGFQACLTNGKSDGNAKLSGLFHK